jgi:putative peptidoglycan lipid II flippase
MSWYALGIPFYCLMKLSLNTFYCRKDMKTPAIVSICCIILNLVLGASLGFLTPLKQGGLSIASVITSTLNNIILIWILRKELGRMPLAGTVKFSLLILVLSGISGAAAYFAYQWIVSHPEWHFLPRGIIPFAGACCAFGVVFILLCLVFRVRELKALFRRFRRKMGK